MTTKGDRKRQRPIQAAPEPIVSDGRRALALLAAVICATVPSPLVCPECGLLEMSDRPTPWKTATDHCTPYTSPSCWWVRRVGQDGRHLEAIT